VSPKGQPRALSYSQNAIHPQLIWFLLGSLHCGALPGHLPPLPVAHHVEALQGRPLHHRHLDSGSVSGGASSHPVRGGIRTEGGRAVQPVHGGVEFLPARVRDFHFPLLRRPHDSHNCAVCVDRDSAEEVQEYCGGEEGVAGEQRQRGPGQEQELLGAEQGRQNAE
jgi:hypothetical protein